MTESLEIHNGPSKYDLMMGLFEQKPVTFALNYNNVKLAVDALARPSEVMNSYIEEFYPIHISGPLWLFQAVIISGRTSVSTGEIELDISNGLVIGIYSEKSRRGFASVDTNWEEDDDRLRLDDWLQSALPRLIGPRRR